MPDVFWNIDPKRRAAGVDLIRARIRCRPDPHRRGNDRLQAGPRHQDQLDQARPRSRAHRHASATGRQPQSAPWRLHCFGKLGTIDLRIDYLRPGIGDHFELFTEVLRAGSHVATTRMKFRGTDCKSLSTGAGAHIVS